MKVTKTVKVPAKPAKQAVPAHTKEVEIHLCDLCAATIDKSQDNRYGSGSSSCYMCKCEICRKGKCMIREYPDGGDYGYNYCRVCHDLRFGKYRVEWEEIDREAERKEEALEAKIIKESLQWTSPK